jgi:radical SAM-linked protein
MRIVFRKGEQVKYISHLDLLRAWERLIRRARLPLAYTQGFNPHPRITIAMPLAVGCSGENEVLDVLFWFENENRVELEHTVLEALDEVMPPGFSVVSVSEVSRQDPALATLFQEAHYQIVLEDIEPSEAQARITEWMAKEEAIVEYRRKSFDLRPLVGALSLGTSSPAEPGRVFLEATLLRDQRGRIGRPDVLLQALGLDPFVRAMVRQEMLFGQPK